MESSFVYLLIYLIISALLASFSNVSCPCTTPEMHKNVWENGSYHHSKAYSSLEESYMDFCMAKGKVSVSFVVHLLCFFLIKEHEVWFWILTVKWLVYTVNLVQSDDGEHIWKVVCRTYLSHWKQEFFEHKKVWGDLEVSVGQSRLFLHWSWSCQELVKHWLMAMP